VVTGQNDGDDASCVAQGAPVIKLGKNGEAKHLKGSCAVDPDLSSQLIVLPFARSSFWDRNLPQIGSAHCEAEPPAAARTAASQSASGTAASQSAAGKRIIFQSRSYSVLVQIARSMEDLMWKGANVAAALYLLAACAEDKEQLKAQTEEAAKAAAQAEAQIAQQDDIRCRSYGRPGSAAYIDCRTSLKIDRAEMKK
jgi:hypothetical protein